MRYGTDAAYQNAAQFRLIDDSLGELETIETLMRVAREIEHVADATPLSDQPRDRGFLGGAETERLAGDATAKSLAAITE